MEIKKIKLLSAFFAAALLVGCASTSTDDTAAAEQAAAAASAAAEQQAAAEAEAARLAAEEEAARLEALANLETVFYFDFDQATLSSETRAALDAQIEVLTASNAKVRLEGHADERGTREYNMALGERRANAVANYLVINGVARYRVETVSYGEERAVAGSSNDSAWSQNRRVELK